MSNQHGHTHRLDLEDASVREWDATVVGVTLNAGGAKLNDTGSEATPLATTTSE